MNYLIIIMLITLAFFGFFIEKKLYNPMTLFCFLWAILIYLASLRLFGMYNYSDKVFFITLIGNIGFSIGYFYTYRFNRKKIVIKGLSNSKREKEDCCYQIRDRIFWASSIIIFLTYASMMFNVAMLMRNGMSYAAIRTLYLHGSDTDTLNNAIYGSQILKQIELFIIKPLFFAHVPVNITLFFKNNKVNRNTIICLINVALYCMVTFGRILLVNIIVEVIICALIMGHKIKKKQNKKGGLKKKIYILIMGAIIVYAIYSLTVARQLQYNNSKSVFQEVYAYLTVTFPLMDYWIGVVDDKNVWTYGTMFVKGILNFIRKTGFNLSIFDQADEIIRNTEIFIPVFPKTSYNAFVSLFFYFYVDFRLFGVLVGSALYGSIMNRTFSNAFKRDIFSVSVFLLLLQSLIKCFFRWEFIQMSYCLAFVCIFIWIKKCPCKEKTEN